MIRIMDVTVPPRVPCRFLNRQMWRTYGVVWRFYLQDFLEINAWSDVTRFVLVRHGLACLACWWDRIGSIEWWKMQPVARSYPQPGFKHQQSKLSLVGCLQKTCEMPLQWPVSPSSSLWPMWWSMPRAFAASNSSQCWNKSNVNEPGLLGLPRFASAQVSASGLKSACSD